MERIEIIAIEGIGEVAEATDLANIIGHAAEEQDTPLLDRDIVIVTHKIVSKAEGRTVDCPDADARLALAMDEARRVLRRRGNLLITETHHGFICANSGVDLSNAPSNKAILLPIDPDRSARRIRDRLRRFADVAVIISDTFGRPWRRGLTDVAIGVAGLSPILDLRGSRDWHGHILSATEVAIADELAGAADLVMGKANGTPAAIVRGYPVQQDDSGAAELVRPACEDLFR